MEERLPQKPDDASKRLDSVPFPHGASWFIVDDMARTLFFTAVAFSLAHICVFALFSTMYIEVGRQKTAAIALCEVQMKRAQSRCEVKTSSLQANITNLTSANAICKFETARLEAMISNYTQRRYDVQSLESFSVSRSAASPFRISSQTTFLTMCMATVPRGEGASSWYLPIIVEALVAQMQEVSAPLKLVVMNARPGKHQAFDLAKQKYAAVSQVAFVDMPPEGPSWVDNSTFEPDNMKNVDDRPGTAVRRQTHDLQHLVAVCSRQEHRGDYTILLEDDFMPCPYALKDVVRAVKRMPGCRPREDWKHLSFSGGMNGVAIPDATA